MPFPPVSLELLRAVKSGLHGAAVLSPAGAPIDVIGALWPQEICAVAALVSKQGPRDLLDRLFAGELASATLDGTMFDDVLTLDPSEAVPNTLGLRPDEAEAVPNMLGLRPHEAEEIGRRRCDDRTVFLGIAGRCVFVVGVAGPDGIAAVRAMEWLCDVLDRRIRAARAEPVDRWQPPPRGSSGSGSPPAEAFVFLPPRHGRREPS